MEQEELAQEDQPEQSFLFGHALRGEEEEDGPEPSLGGALQELSGRGDPDVHLR